MAITDHIASRIRILRDLSSSVDRIIESDLSWEDKYGLIFSDVLSRKVFEVFLELNLKFEYYDPDASYEEDVNVFAWALKERVNELTPLLT